ncbi:MAG: phosphoribosyl-ATP diphosphatase [Lachnospiraceae bacterium]|nr:phosphoribosyl-ATP diphosphatase [Lachnospiraceae bacterium]
MEDNSKILYEVYNTIIDRRDNPKEGSYTNYLFEKGIDKMLKKIGEECAEVIIAAKNPDKNETIYEAADLMYHLSVVLAEKGLNWDDIFNELKGRRK